MNFRKSQVETWQRYGICALKEDGQWDLWDVDLQTATKIFIRLFSQSLRLNKLWTSVGGLDPFFDSFLQSSWKSILQHLIDIISKQ